MSTSNASLESWVEEVARLTKPESIHWCTGSDAENASLIEAMLRSGDLIKLNPSTHPNCYLHRSQDRKSTRLNSSHSQISYAVFCLKKKKKRYEHMFIQKT